MKICFYEDKTHPDFSPLTLMRPVYALRAGILPLFRRAERFFESADIVLTVRDALSGTLAAEYREYPVNIIKRSEDQPVLFLNGRIRDYGNLPERCQQLRFLTRFVDGDGSTVGVYFPSDILKKTPAVSGAEAYEQVYRDAGSDCDEAVTSATLYRYCWEIVADIDKEIAADFAHLVPSLSGLEGSTVHKGAYLINDEDIFVGNQVEILPTSVIDASHGPVFIGDNCRIDAQAAVYGPTYIGPNSRVVAGKIEGCSIGHTCRVGGEAEASVFHSYVNKYHAGFIGHSYVGSWVNFGAMTTNSDLKNNYSNIRVTLGGESIDTGSIKVGSFIGDHTKFGIGTLLNTGINIGVACNLFGGTLIADKEIPSFQWGNSDGYQDYRFDKAMETIRRSMDRRNTAPAAGEEELLQAIAEGRAEDKGIVRF